MVEDQQGEDRRTDRRRSDGACRLAAVERAKQDGSWTILDGPEAGIVPDDLAAAMEAGQVTATFDALTPGGRKAILAWLVTAKRAATRVTRIEKTVLALQRGESPL